MKRRNSKLDLDPGMDAMVAGEAPPDATATDEEPELPFWANEEGLAVDPDRPGYTLAGDPYKGDPNAPLVVVEFSDFQCPSCARHALDAQPVIDETFVDTGQIMWVFKHLPLSIHPQAPVAAAAAECAGDQGAFFEMDRALFQSQDNWSVDDPDPLFISLAGDLGLDTEAFTACLGSREPLERVLADMYDAQQVSNQTPTFVVIYGGRGALFQGTRDAESFVSLLQSQLDAALEAEAAGS